MNGEKGQFRAWNLFFIACMFLPGLIFCMCNNGRSVVYENRGKLPEIIKTVTCSGIEGDRVVNLFDSEKNSGAALTSAYGDDISILLTRPVYIDMIRVHLNEQENIKNSKKLSKYLRIELYSAENESFGDYAAASLHHNKNEIIVAYKDFKYADLLKSQVIKIDLTQDCNGSVNPGDRIIISEIEIIHHNKMLYRPGISYSRFKRTFPVAKNSEGKLLLKYPDLFYEKESGAVKDLLFYSLAGNSEAESIFVNSHPAAADYGEWHSAMIEWYEITKTALIKGK